MPHDRRGNRFRLLVNEVERAAGQAVAKAAVARRLALPARSADGGRGLDLRRRRASYRLQPLRDDRDAGGLWPNGGHRNCYIDDKTTCASLLKELRANEVYYGLARGFNS